MNSRQGTFLLGVLAFSCLLRLGAAVYLGNQVEALPGTHDQISYHNLAIRLLGGHGFSFGQRWWPWTAPEAPTAHWSYLYTFYLAGVYAFFGQNPLAARIIQALISGLLHPFLAYLVGKQVFGVAAGLVAAALTAVYTYFFYYSASLMSETFYIMAILGSLYFAIQLGKSTGTRFAIEGSRSGLKWAIGLGVCLGAAVLLRQLYLLFVPILFFWILWSGGRRRLGSLIVAGIILVASVTPITIYNYGRFHRLVLLNTNAGYAFFWGNHPIYGTRFIPILPTSTYQELIPEELRGLDEAALDQALLERGVGFLLKDPVRIFLLSASRIPHYFMFWPSADSGLISNISRVSSFGLLLPVMIYGLWLAFSRRTGGYFNQPVFLLILFISFYTVIHLVTWTLVRYRLPVDAVLLIFCGLAGVDLLPRIPIFKKLAHAFV